MSWWDEAPVAGTKLYSPNPDAPKVSGGPDIPLSAPQAPTDSDSWWKMAPAAPPDRPFSERATRFLTAIPQGINSGLFQGATFLGDASGRLAKLLGISPENTPLPSQQIQNAGNEMRDRNGITYTPNITPETIGERAALATGEAIGNVASSAVPGGMLARTAAPAVQGFRVAAPTYGQTVGKALSTSPIAQTAFTAAGNIVGNETDNPYLGAATSFALPILAHGAQRTVSAAPAASTQDAEHRALLEFGRQNNLGPLTAGKILDSPKLQTLESAATKTPVPFLGRDVADTEIANRNSFQRAALEKAGTYGATAATPDVLTATKDRIGRSFNNLENSTTVSIDPKFDADIANAKADFSKQLADQMPASVTKKLDELAQAATVRNQPGVQNVTLDGTTYKNIRSKLSAQLATASGTDKQAIGGMIDALDGAMERSLPADQVKDWQIARQQWRNYLALDKSVGANNANTAIGNMSTAAFGQAADGNADLERLAQYANRFVGDKMPNTSGTASHSTATSLLTHGGGAYAAFEGLRHLGLNPLHAGLALGSVALPAIVERGLNNPATRAALLARYRMATPSFITPSLMGATAADLLKGNGRGG